MRRLALVLLPTLAAAVDVEAAKLATPDAMPVEPGAYEIGLGLSWARTRAAWDADRQLQDRDGSLIERTVEAGLTVGLVTDVDAAISLGWARITDCSDPDCGQGFTDVGLGVRWRFLEHESLALAVIPEVSLPAGDGHPEDRISTGSNLWSAGATLAATASLDRLALGAALGRGWITGEDRDRGDLRGTWTADLALGWQATADIQPEIELHYARDLNTGDTADAWVLTATAGILVGTPYGRFGAGFDQALAGCDAGRTTTAMLQWAKGF